VSEDVRSSLGAVIWATFASVAAGAFAEWRTPVALALAIYGSLASIYFGKGR
jgi:hypothetical protein